MSAGVRWRVANHGWWLAWLAVFAAVYLPAVGHGFIKDDFIWIADSTARSLSDLSRVLLHDNGFYRPAVALTFTANEWMFGLWPKAYGLTNFTLALLCAATIVRLARILSLGSGAAVAAAIVWLFNFHGISGSMLWISGRTALLVTLASVASTAFLLSRRLTLAAAFLILALFSKEEAVLLPAIQLGWLVLLQRVPGRRADRRIVSTWAAISVVCVTAYLLVRSTTNAMTPLTAPSYYDLTPALARISENLLHYTDWTLTFAVGVVLVSLASLGVAGRLTPERRTLIACGALWIVGAFAVTLFVPSRSDLYVCLPSVGSSLIAAVVIQASWDAAADARRRRALVVAVLLPFLLAPVYYLRTRRMVGIATLSSHVLDELGRRTTDLSDGAVVLLQDDRSQRRITLDATFGLLLGDAFRLTNGRELSFWIDPPVANSGGLVPPCATCAARTFYLVDGHLVSNRTTEPTRP